MSDSSVTGVAIAKDGTTYRPLIPDYAIKDVCYFYDGPLCGTVEVAGRLYWFFAVDNAADGWRIHQVIDLPAEEIQHQFDDAARDAAERDAPVPYDVRFAERPLIGFFVD